MDIEISPRKILVILLSTIGILIFANIMGIVSAYVFNHPSVFGLVGLFDLDGERNIPTLYSSLQLIVAAFLLSIISAKHRSNGKSYVPWLVLSMIFLFLAVDETAQIHERASKLVQMVYEPTGLLLFAWVIPFGIAVLVFVLAYSRFLFRLPKETMRWFVASGAIFVTGAIGFEMLGAKYYESHGLNLNNVVSATITTFEESLEMLGIALFIYTLLAYVSSEFQYLRGTIRN